MAELTRRGWRHRVARYCSAVARRLGASENGSVTVEFAAVAFLFFGMLMSIMQSGLTLWAEHILDKATATSSRLVLTGQAKDFSREQFKARLCEKLDALISCDGVKVDVTTYPDWNIDLSPPVDGEGNVTATGANYQTGEPNSIVVVRAVYEFPMLIPTDFYILKLNHNLLANGNRLLVSTAVFKNEPYNTSGGS